MAKRRTKKQQKEIEDGIKLLLILVAGASYYFTRDYVITGWMVGLTFIAVIVFAVYQNKKKKERLSKSGIKDIDSMDGIQFEYYLKELYLSRGFGVEVTNASGDYGADLLLTKAGKKIVVQAKRYSKDVGIKAVQEVIGAKSYYKADETWVVSNSYFTKAARELAHKGNVLLVDRDALIDFILVFNPSIEKGVPAEVKQRKSSSHGLTCVKCGSPMVLKTGKRGAFYGCSGFPKCRYTRDSLETKKEIRPAAESKNI
ncbi:restriction endonuclease [Neobacillus niacini]|uniref:restriction endonuclease n=1 Tax=Neobacillus niacini TaxID=86668 RepID=UPI003B01EB6C